MKKRISKNSRRILSFVLALVFLTNLPIMEAEASEKYSVGKNAVEQLEFVIQDTANEDNAQKPNARTALYNCIINVHCSSNGMLVECFVDSAGTASVIGVKDIKIQKKVWYGWKTVATSSGAEAHNTSVFAGSILYTGAEYGETYRVSCVHYADVNGYEEVDNEIGSFVFTY